MLRLIVFWTGVSSDVRDLLAIFAQSGFFVLLDRLCWGRFLDDFIPWSVHACSGTLGELLQEFAVLLIVVALGVKWTISPLETLATLLKVWVRRR